MLSCIGVGLLGDGVLVLAIELEPYFALLVGLFL